MTLITCIQPMQTMPDCGLCMPRLPLTLICLYQNVTAIHWQANNAWSVKINPPPQPSSSYILTTSSFRRHYQTISHIASTRNTAIHHPSCLTTTATNTKALAPTVRYGTPTQSHYAPALSPKVSSTNTAVAGQPLLLTRLWQLSFKSELLPLFQHVSRSQ